MTNDDVRQGNSSVGGVSIVKHIVEKINVTFADLHMPRLLRYYVVGHHVDNETVVRIENTRQHCLLS